MNKELNRLKNVIDYIQYVYDSVNDEWISYRATPVNLKKKQVKDIGNDINIQKYIYEYNSFLSERDIHIKIMFEYNDVRARIKTINSYTSKIEKYNNNNFNGSIPIKKCLNDMLGMRIILNEHYSYEMISNYINSTFYDKYKCIDSSKQSYKATHLYFQTDNFSFPWELQIWNREDEKNNIESHKIYKQEYTDWENNI